MYVHVHVCMFLYTVHVLYMYAFVKIILMCNYMYLVHVLLLCMYSTCITCIYSIMKGTWHLMTDVRRLKKL